MLDGVDMVRCPLRPQLDDPYYFTNVINQWAWRERGFLADDGTYLDQAAKIPTLMAIIDSAKADGDEQNQAREKARNAAGKSRGGIGIGPKRMKRPRPGGL